MPKQRTPAQQAFIDKFIVGKGKTEADASKMTKAYLEFDRRLQKVKVFLEKIPDDGEKDRLSAAVKEVEEISVNRGEEARRRANALPTAVRANAGLGKPTTESLNAAYRELETVKSQARSLAKGQPERLSPTDVQAEFKKLDLAVRAAFQELRYVLAGMDRVIAEVSDPRNAPPTDGTGSDITDYRDRMSLNVELWRGARETWQRRASTAASSLLSLSLQLQLPRFRVQATALEQSSKSATKKVGKSVLEELALLEQQTTIADRMVTGSLILSLFTEKDTALQRALDTTIGFQRREPDASPAAFAHLDQRELDRVGRARTEMSEAAARDRFALAPDASIKPRPSPPPPARRFVTSELIDDEVAGLKEQDLSAAKIKAVKDAVVSDLEELIGRESDVPNSDLLFDLSMRSLNDLRAEVGASLGLSGDPEEWPDLQGQLANELARAMQATICASNPNRISSDTVQVTFEGQPVSVPEEITVGNVTYTDPEMIGRGGLGNISRYHGQAADGTPTTIVVKSTIAASGDDFVTLPEPGSDKEGWTPEQKAAVKRREMVSEMRIHRQVMGGEEGEPPANVVPFKGAATGEDGSLHMVLEEAKGGDMADFLGSVSVLQDIAVIPPAAHRALKQNLMRDALLGLQAMHERVALHNDIKAPNFLMDAQGKAMISDFGSGQDTETAETAGIPAYSEAYIAPEFLSRRSEESDIFTLGAMIHGVYDVQGAEGTVARGANYGGTARTGHTATAFDRLRNAMLDDEAEKRPTLEGLLNASVLEARAFEHVDPDSGEVIDNLTVLKTALAAYNVRVGRELGPLSRTANRARVTLQKLDSFTRPLTPDEQRQQKGEVVALRDALRAIERLNAKDENTELIGDIKAAAAAFT